MKKYQFLALNTKTFWILFLVFQNFTYACSGNDSEATNEESEEPISETQGEVTNVTVSGNEQNYTFNVTVKSPDTGCDQYADWWEVISSSGELIYRRILAHSHVNEQPFTRSGGAVAITEEQIVYVRVHMSTGRYGAQVVKGSVKEGFQQSQLETNFAEQLANVEPLPDGCAF